MNQVKLSVEVETESKEYVCLTGNLEILGQWNPNKVVPLQKHQPNGVVNNNLWSIVLELPENEVVFYRYCIATNLETEDGHQQQIIRKWETNINPRSVQVKGLSEIQNEETSILGQYDGYNNISRGWLTSQHDIQLRLSDNPINMYKSSHKQQTYSVRCVPKDYRVRQSESNISFMDEDSNEGPQTCQFTDVLVSVLREDKCLLCKQGQFGEIYQQNDFMIFNTESLFIESLGFQLEFYVHDNRTGNNVPRYIGYSHLIPLKSKCTLGEKSLPILSLKHKPIGELTVKYLIIKPLQGVEFNMESSFQTYWKKGEYLDVGHRGMGSSYKKLALVRENTVASLCAAAQNGADLVEFDVMLTQDLHTVIYHDFAVCVTSKKKYNENGSPHELLPIPVKDLTLQQLQSMKLSHLSSKVGELIDINGDVDPHDVQPFPTLQQCFMGVDESLGFNIEIKYPLQDVEGVWEMTGFMDHNTYIDMLLQAVFNGAGSRRIIFSSFDPESCILIQSKQNKYPVLFLSNGPTQRYTPYMDPRAQGYEIAMYFALSSGLLGVDLLSEALLHDLSIIKKVKDKGLVLFVWGEDNNDKETISLLKKNGVQGIIYDRIDFYKPDKKKYFCEVEEEEIKNSDSIDML